MQNMWSTLHHCSYTCSGLYILLLSTVLATNWFQLLAQLIFEQTGQLVFAFENWCKQFFRIGGSPEKMRVRDKARGKSVKKWDNNTAASSGVTHWSNSYIYFSFGAVFGCFLLHGSMFWRAVYFSYQTGLQTGFFESPLIFQKTDSVPTLLSIVIVVGCAGRFCFFYTYKNTTCNDWFPLSCVCMSRRHEHEHEPHAKIQSSYVTYTQFRVS